MVTGPASPEVYSSDFQLTGRGKTPTPHGIMPRVIVIAFTSHY
jgi:hypothetical protein